MTTNNQKPKEKLIPIKDENGNLIFIPDQSNIFQEALDQGIDLHEAVNQDS